VDNDAEGSLIQRWESGIRAQGSQYLVVADGDMGQGPASDGPRNGLLDWFERTLTVTTGLDVGRVPLHLETWSQAPDLDLDQWDDVVEAELATVDGVIQPADLLEGPPRRMRNLAHAGPGSYRLRVSVRGRDAASTGKGPELHRLQCWAAAAGDDAGPTPHKLTDEHGRRLRGEMSVAAPVLQPWELAGALAMHEFIIAVQAASPSEPTTTLVTTEVFTATRRKMFTQLSELRWLVGNGGHGTGGTGGSTVYNSPERSWTLFLDFVQTSATSPERCRWSTNWNRWDSVRSDFQPTGVGAGTLDLELSWSAPQTTATFTHTGVPVSCAASLAALWQYWLAKRKNQLGPNDCAWNPWTLIP
jgi:hypothetical protein